MSYVPTWHETEQLRLQAHSSPLLTLLHLSRFFVCFVFFYFKICVRRWRTLPFPRCSLCSLSCRQWWRWDPSSLRTTQRTANVHVCHWGCPAGLCQPHYSLAALCMCACKWSVCSGLTDCLPVAGTLITAPTLSQASASPSPPFPFLLLLLLLFLCPPAPLPRAVDGSVERLELGW